MSKNRDTTTPATRLLRGDTLQVLRTLPDNSVQCRVTSPPYWGLRDYGTRGQIGLEPKPEEYVAKLVAVFREVRRVLRDDGTLWLNMGDSYANDGKWGGSTGGKHASGLHGEPVGRGKRETGLKAKDLVGIPWLLAFALRADGWYLRQDIIWAKPNPMPESVTDRCTKSHEYLFLLTKSARYYFDHEAFKEPAVRGYAGSTFTKGKTALHQEDRASKKDRQEHAATRNRRDVWTIATQPYKEAHFAVFPTSLVEPCILAGAPARCCAVCGAPYANEVHHTKAIIQKSERTAQMGEEGRTRSGGTQVAPAHSDVTYSTTSTCRCASPAAAPVILDPFCGSGTVGAVAKKFGLRFIGIDLNPKYLALARRRINAAQRLAAAAQGTW